MTRMASAILTGKHKRRDAVEARLRNAALDFANAIPTGRGLFAARRELEKAAVALRDVMLEFEMRGEE